MSNKTTRPSLRTRLTERYGVDLPFVNAGMAFIATMAAAVARAGGLGTIGCAAMAPDYRLRVMEKDQTIDSMARTIEELKRKAEQGSQQSQGEVLELDLEEVLRGRFPTRPCCGFSGPHPKTTSRFKN